MIYIPGHFQRSLLIFWFKAQKKGDCSFFSPVYKDPVVVELIIQEDMSEINTNYCEQQVAKFAEEEAEGVSAELVVNMLLKMLQHFSFLLVHVFWGTQTSCSCK